MRAVHVVAVILVVAGTALAFPFLGIVAPVVWIIGVAIVWSQSAWHPRERLALTLVWPGGIALPLSVALVATRTCVQAAESVATGVVASESCVGFAMPPVIGVPVFVVALAAPVVTGAVALHRLRRRAGVERA